MQQSSFTNNQQSLFMMAAAIFVSVTAAVIVSTLVIMSLMRGEIASALSANVQTNGPATAQTTSGCSVPAGEVNAATSGAGSAAMVSDGTDTAAAPLMSAVKFAKYVPAAAHNSYNNTNTTTMNTTNNVTNTEVHSKTVIKDSYNDNSVFSHNPVVVKDNTVNVNSNNNSGNTSNTTNNTTTNVTTTNTNSNNTTSNVASNNTTNVASNNTVENHVLSDNKTIVVVPAI